MILFGVVAMALVATKLPLFVVFGRPGSGKSTVADAATVLLTEEGTKILSLDLDVCVPDWMKDNFADGVYPTLKERKKFAEEACDYVLRAIENASGSKAAIVSFSFVNEDLRIIFRQRYPYSIWLLIAVDESEANARVLQRKGHFYKGKTTKAKALETVDRLESDNSEWAFAPVTFQHKIVDGMLPIDINAKKVADFVKEHIH